MGIFQSKIFNFKHKNSTYGTKGVNSAKIDYRNGCKLRNGIKIIILLLVFGCNINNNYSKVCKESSNKNNHILNGNISKKGNISLYTWNKGNSCFKNRRNDILVTLERYKPDVFAIHEANFNILNDRGFPDYNIEANTLCRGNSLARTIVLIKNTIAYKRRKDLENDYVSSVWVQVIISKRVSILISSYYRQWSLPKELNFESSNSIQNQTDRYQLFTNQVTKATKEGKDILILTDENIDSLQDKNKSGFCKNIQLKAIRDQSIIENSLTYHNNKATFNRRGVKSCIDYIISNCPTKVSNVRTHDGDTEIFGYRDLEYNNIMSDHYLLSCTYNNKKINIPQQFLVTRNSNLLTRQSLNDYFSCNPYLQEIFSETDPNKIAETLLNELSIIIECIAPSRKVQCSKKYAPWINQNFIRESKIKDELHRIAKGSNNMEDWRNFRAQRNLVNNLNKSNKSSYYNYKLNIKKDDVGDEFKYQNDIQSKVMWRTFKDLTNNNNQIPPRLILHEGNLVTSVRKIVNIANNFFIEKIRKIRESFPINDSVSPLEILQNLVPKNKKEFCMKWPKLGISKVS